MLKTYLYLPEELDRRVKRLAKDQDKSKAEILRQVIEDGLQKSEAQNKSGAQVLLELADYAKKHNLKGPRDAAVNHDYYLWGLPKKNPRIKP